MEPPPPSPLERSAASALLLVSTTKPHSPPPPLFDTDSSEEGLRLLAAVAYCHRMNLQVIENGRAYERQKEESVKPAPAKVIRKSRSNIRQKVNPAPSAKVVWSESVSIDGGSCLSSSASEDSSARSQCARKGSRDEPRRKKVGGSRGCYGHIERRAEAILKQLSSSGCFSEVKIRRVLGNGPDNSIAQRMSLKQEEVKRSGKGGRQDPYIYTVCTFWVNGDAC